MAAKTIFLCETNHLDQAMKIAESLIVKKLIKSGYNQLFMEWDAIYVESFYNNISKYYQNYKYASDKQIFRLFELSKKCLGNSDYSIGATWEGQITAFEAILSGLQVNGFEGASRASLAEKADEICKALADKSIYYRFGPKKIQDFLNSIDITKAFQMRDLEIVNNFAKLHNNTLEADKNIIIAGLAHCVDFYNYASDKGILDKLKFVQIKTNLTILSDANLGDTVSSEMEEDNNELGLTHLCGESMSKQIKENLGYFGPIVDALTDPEEDYMCDIKYSSFVKDQTNVIRCDINVNDLDSYQVCLFNVTHAIPDIV